MATPETRNHSVETGGLTPGYQPRDGTTESTRNGLYLMSSLPAGVAILSVLVAIFAAWSQSSNVAVIALWVFVVAAGLWVGGTVYILSLNWRHFWNRLRRRNTGRSAD